MGKSSKSYVCQSCGAVHPRWSGKCEACGEWNCIVEEVSEAIPKGLGGTSGKKKGRSIEFVPLKGEGEAKNYPRHQCGMKEFDRVTGGGLVPGSATLIGGDPGIGKSTILLQVVCALAKKGVKSLYISGEEAVDQVRMRAQGLALRMRRWAWRARPMCAILWPASKTRTMRRRSPLLIPFKPCLSIRSIARPAQ